MSTGKYSFHYTRSISYARASSQSIESNLSIGSIETPGQFIKKTNKLPSSKLEQLRPKMLTQMDNNAFKPRKQGIKVENKLEIKSP